MHKQPGHAADTVNCIHTPEVADTESRVGLVDPCFDCVCPLRSLYFEFHREAYIKEKLWHQGMMSCTVAPGLSFELSLPSGGPHCILFCLFLFAVFQLRLGLHILFREDG